MTRTINQSKPNQIDPDLHFACKDSKTIVITISYVQKNQLATWKTLKVDPEEFPL